jgi:phospholipase A-2-activating protein
MFHLGYIVTGGQDSIINIWAIGPSPGEPLYTLLGHSDNVCALHVGGNGTIVSGSWDKCVLLPPVRLLTADPNPSRRTAKVWVNFQLINDLVGHTQPVWAVLAIRPDEYLTGTLLHVLTFPRSV